MKIHYDARVQYPDAADVERVTDEVIAKLSRHLPSRSRFGADVIAAEIKQRLCAEICVEVDLVLSASTEQATPQAAPAQLVANWLAASSFRGSLPGPI